MNPHLALHDDVDVMDLSPLIRGMVLTLRYADEHGGIGLTKSDAMNRKFVHWAADNFAWPGHTAEDLFVVNKVLNEQDMFPLWPVRDLLHHLKLIRRFKGTLRPSRLGRALSDDPQRLFDLAAPIYLYGYVHDEYSHEEHGVVGNWHIFLNLINIEARRGCTLTHLTGILYGLNETDRHDPFDSSVLSAFKLNVIRPLCWLGLLREDREGLGFLEDGTLVKTPLWSASLKLESDNQSALRRVRSRTP